MKQFCLCSIFSSVGRFSKHLSIACVLILGLSACETENAGEHPATPTEPIKLPAHNVADRKITASVFEGVTQKIKLVAVEVCEKAEVLERCDYDIVIDSRADLPPNAYQTIKRSGQPYLVFTQTLLDELKNEHELAFIAGHETAHYIRRHLPETQERMLVGALFGAILAGAAGASGSTISDAAEMGARIGARIYSKDQELEADELGAFIAMASGYDALVGVDFFNRSSDPGNQFLGTHPPNQQRIAKVVESVKAYRQKK